MDIFMRMDCDTGKSVCLFGKEKCIVSQRHATQSFVVLCNTVKEFSAKRGKANTFYQLLSLSSSEKVGFEEIRKAYRSKALQFHPDVCPSNIKDECTRQFVELRKAYEVLSDPQARRMYDYELSLDDSFGAGHRGHGKFGGDGVRGSTFPKEVWERQLSGLQKRCVRRSNIWTEGN